MREHRTPSPPLPHQQLVSPKDIYPIPTYKRDTTKKPHARSGKASEITLTPYREELEQSLQKKKAKELVSQLNLDCVLAPEKNNSTKSVRSEKTATSEEEIAVHEDVGQPSTSKGKTSRRKRKVEIAVREDVAQPSTSKGKTSRRKRKVSSSSSSNSSEDSPLADSSSDESGENDAECLFCTEKFSDDKYGERWLKCYQCGRWAHEDCREIKSSTFIWLFCEGKGFFE
uniref:Corepressor interacting with RBPJ 1-like n=1 Tax=Diabrotica virgifera virgifera TaxID=50390 RepID=A0A6P7H6J4_DIAVI